MKNLVLFLWKHRFFLLFLILEAFSISLIVSNNSFQRSKFVSASNGFTGGVLSVYDDVSSYFGLKAINKQLADENARLRNLLKTSFMITDTANYMVSDTVYRQQYSYQQSKILSNSYQKRNNYLILNKGSVHGYATDMGVVAPNGIVGIINSTTENYSSVISVLHSKSAIGAKLKNSSYSGTITWDGVNYQIGQLENIPSHVELKVGDTVITSGYSFIFPEGLLIGTIAKVKDIPGRGFYDIDIKFSVDYNQIDYVYVVFNLLKEQQEAIRESNTDE